MLTPEQKENYLKNPNNCPKCDSKNISSDGSLNADHCDYVWQRIACEDCQFEWDDIYVLKCICEVVKK